MIIITNNAESPAEDVNIGDTIYYTSKHDKYKEVWRTKVEKIGKVGGLLCTSGKFIKDSNPSVGFARNNRVWGNKRIIEVC